MKCSELIMLLERIIQDKGDCSVGVYAEDRNGDLCLAEAEVVEYLDFQEMLVLYSE